MVFSLFFVYTQESFISILLDRNWIFWWKNLDEWPMVFHQYCLRFRSHSNSDVISDSIWFIKLQFFPCVLKVKSSSSFAGTRKCGRGVVYCNALSAVALHKGISSYRFADSYGIQWANYCYWEAGVLSCELVGQLACIHLYSLSQYLLSTHCLLGTVHTLGIQK